MDDCSHYGEQQDLISVGAYQAGSDPQTDAAIALRPEMVRFLVQRPEDQVRLAESRQSLLAVLAAGEAREMAVAQHG